MSSQRPPAGPQPGDQLRHYQLLGPLRDESGHAWAAYDRRLERRVVVRLFELEGTMSRVEGERTLGRLGRTAATRDPGLVAVHDGWIEAGRLVVAYELVEAPTLRQLGVVGPARAAEVACRVASALASLHAVGVAHGDLRSEWVYLGRGDEVRVAGYALTLAAPAAPHAAPELRRGEPASAPADQYALCVLLRELATGSTDARADADLPAWLRRIVARGVQAAPAARYPGMAELGDALSRTPARRRRAAIAALVGGTVIATTVLAAQQSGRRAADVCGGAERLLAGAWDDARKQEVRRAFAATRVPFAERAADHVESRLDRHGLAWTNERMDACAATHVDGVQSETVLDRRMMCLDRSLRELNAVVDVLVAADAGVVEHASQMVDALPAPELCGEMDRLLTMDGEGEAGAGGAAAEELRRRLAGISAERAAGRYRPALAAATELEAEARAAAADSLLAEVLEVRGDLLAKTGDGEGARSVLREAVHAAWNTGQERLAATAWTELAFVLGDLLARPDEAERAIRHASAAIDRIGGDDLLRAELTATEGVLRIDQGRFEEAVDRFRESLALRERSSEPHSTRLGSAWHNLANAHARLAQYDEAAAAYARARAVWERSLGEGHPLVASLHNNVGVLAYARGDLETAEREVRRAYEVRRAALGPEHPDVAGAVDNLGVIAGAHEDHDTALAHYREALAIRRKVYRRDHPSVGDSLINVGTSLQAMGRVDEALAHYRGALEAYRTTLGEQHPWTALAVHNEGRALHELGRYEEAVARHRRALSIRMRVYGTDHPQVGTSHLELAGSLEAIGRGEEAAEHRTEGQRIAAISGSEAPG